MFVALVCPSLTATAQDGGAGPDGSKPTEVQRRLVQQLGEASIIAREEAAAKLTRLGQSAKSVLTEALDDKDAEVRWRVRLLLNRLLEPSADEDSGQPAAAQVPTAAQRDLIQQLGDGSFFTRERASAQLISQGASAQAALTEALKDPDLEIRFRATSILNRVLQQQFDAQLIAFIAGEKGVSLPGWKRVREFIGDSRDARRMFVEMTRKEAELLEAYEKQGPELQELFAARVARLKSQATSNSTRLKILPQPSLATLLLVGTDKKAFDYRDASQLYMLLCQPSVMRSIGTQHQPPIIRSLLEKWVDFTTSSGAYYGLSLTLKYDLEEMGLRQATKVLEGATVTSSMPHRAIVNVGRFGGPEHIPLVKPQLENKKICHRWSNRAIKKKGTIDTQVRDVALVVLLRLRDKDPKQYGFRLLKENPETMYYAYTFGFVDDEEREAAHAKWAAESKSEQG